MKAILQRVQKGKVSVEGEITAEIGIGMVVLIGIAPEDTEVNAQKLAHKIAHLRIFEDLDGKMNLSLLDIGGEVLVVPQFTLFADTNRGHRPSFTGAGSPSLAEPLAAYFAECLRNLSIKVKEGKFRAHMLVEIHNDGPVTIAIEV